MSSRFVGCFFFHLFYFIFNLVRQNVQPAIWRFCIYPFVKKSFLEITLPNGIPGVPIIWNTLWDIYFLYLTIKFGQFTVIYGFGNVYFIFLFYLPFFARSTLFFPGNGRLDISELIDNINVIYAHSIHGESLMRAFKILDPKDTGFIR